MCTRLSTLGNEECTQFSSSSLIAGWAGPPIFPLLVTLDIKDLPHIYLTYLNIHLVSTIPHSLPEIKGQLALHAEGSAATGLLKLCPYGSGQDGAGAQLFPVTASAPWFQITC